MDTHANIKLQKYTMPDGSTLEIESAKNYKFVVVTQDPAWRIIAKCNNKTQAANQLAYYQLIWAGHTEPLGIMPRTSFSYPMRDYDPGPAPASATDPNWKPPAGWKIGDPL